MLLRLLVVLALIMAASPSQAQSGATPPARYFEQAAADRWSGGARAIEIATPKGKFRVWTKRVGNNPKLKVLLLHGGPGMTHEYLEAFDSYLPREGVEYIYYDQLGSGNSDHPEDDSLWTVERFVDEVEQVRTALGLNRDNFCLYGQSWGGILAIEYALKHNDALKCLVISNMMASAPEYARYAERVLMPAMDQKQLGEVKALEAAGKTEDARYMEILGPLHYEQHVLRRPMAEWPDPVLRALTHANQHIYTLMQGPSELGISGRLEKWDRSADLGRINVPTLVMAGRYDTMDPAALERMAKQIPKGEYWLCPNGSHLSLYDDQERYFTGLLGFLRKFD